MKEIDFSQKLLSNSMSFGVFFTFARYWTSSDYKELLKAKEKWDPDNIFNHCHSVGSTTQNCCPPDV